MELSTAVHSSVPASTNRARVDRTARDTSNIAPLPGGFPRAYLYWTSSHDQKNLSAEQNPSQAHPRVPRTHGDQARPAGAERAACQGPQASQPEVTPKAGTMRPAPFPRAPRLLQPSEFSDAYQNVTPT